MEKYGIEKVETMDDVENYLDQIAKNEPSLIPLDIGSDFDARMLYDLFWQKETVNRLEKINPMQLMGYTKKGDDTVTVFNETEDPAFLTAVEKLQDWKNRGFWSKSAVVNTQNNKEYPCAPRMGYPCGGRTGRCPCYRTVVSCKWHVHFLKVQKP